jgi:hypothetical protein
MTNINKITITLAFLIFFAADVFSVSAGTTIFNFLKLPKNAVQASLAGMTTFGENMYFSNPAVIGFIDRYNITASHAPHFQNTNYNSFIFVAPVKKSRLSLSYFGLDYGKMDRTFEADNGDYIMDGTTFGAADSCIQVNMGHAVSQTLSLGAGLKYIWANIDDSKMSAIAADISALFLSESTWKIAGGIENLGPKVEGGYPLPINMHLSYANSSSDSCNYGFELKTFFDGKMWLKGAVEVNKNKLFFLRGGYSLALTNSDSSLGEWYRRNLTLGFGFNIKSFSINYAWLPFGDLGSTSVISLQAAF